MSEKTECPECGHEMKLIRIKDKEFLKCEFCGEETTEVTLKGLSLLKEESTELTLVGLGVAEKTEE